MRLPLTLKNNIMHYDLAIIGAGWAGFNAAIRARELGLKACLIDKGPLGGTCLNRGCIPTKALIQSAKIYNLAKKSSLFGIDAVEARVNFTKIQERKEKVVQQLRQGMQFMLKGVDFLNAEAKILSGQEINAGGKNIAAKFILVACGAKPMEIGPLKFDGKKIVSSDDILSLKEIPRSLLIIGGGVIGCEFASLFSALGSRVSIVELTPQLLPGVDKEVARKLESAYKKKGILVNTNTDATGVDLNNYDLVLLGIGRSADTSGLDLDKIGVKLDKAKITVDECLRTSVTGIYAAGDCASKIMLAHFAAYQGRLAAENIAQPDKQKKADAQNIPSCIFSDPEIGSVGISEEDAAQKGIEIKVNKFDFLGSGMARILEETEGFIKIISDKKSGVALGACVIGPRATELIATLTLAVSCRLTGEQIRNTIFAHPSLSESISDALKENYGV